MNHVPSFVGVEKGIFLKHGIDLKLKVLATGQEMSKALQAGEVQIIGSAFSNYPGRGRARHGGQGRGGDDGRPHRPLLRRARSACGRARAAASRRSRTWPASGWAWRSAAPATSTSRCCSRRRAWRATRSRSSTCRPATRCRRCRAAAWTPSATWEPFGSLVEAKVPDAVLVSAGRRPHQLLHQHGDRHRAHRQEPRRGRALRDRRGRGDAVHAQEPRRGRRDRHPVGAGARGGRRPQGARVT